MSKRINKFVNWKDKEYAHVIADSSADYCGICVFSQLCKQVATKELKYDDSPMSICEQLSDAENSNFTFFVDSEEAKKIK